MERKYITCVITNINRPIVSIDIYGCGKNLREISLDSIDQTTINPDIDDITYILCGCYLHSSQECAVFIVHLLAFSIIWITIRPPFIGIDLEIIRNCCCHRGLTAC
jgi:hypothetical protein